METKETFIDALKFIAKHKYSLTLAFFLLWLFVLGTPTVSFSFKKDREIKELRKQIHAYETETEQNKAMLLKLKTEKGTVERIARERYFMQKDGEVVYRIEDEKSSK